MAHFHGAISGVHLHGNGESQAAVDPVITSVTPVSGSALAVAWTGTATQYRLDGGSAVSLPDGTSPDTITGLTAATTYSIELRNGAGAWSAAVSGTTDTIGSGGGALDVTLDATGGSGTFSGSASSPAVAAVAATGGSGTFAGTASSPALVSMAATGGSGTFAGSAGQAGVALDATGGSGTFSGTASSPATATLAATGGSGTFSGSASVSSGGGTGATAAEIWGYVMSNGQTAEANVLAILAGLQAGTFGVDVQYMNGAEVIGNGTEADKWRGVGVPN